MINRNIITMLQHKEIILDFDGVVTKLDIRWENVRKRLNNVLRTDELLDLTRLYMYAQSISKKEIYLKYLLEEEIKGLRTHAVSPLFLYVKENNIKIHIFSSNTHAAIYNFFKTHNYLSHVKTISSIESVKYIKPHPEGLLNIIKNRDNKNYIFIGDSINDKIASGLANIEYIKYNI